jgi:hypothetical protein
MPFTPDVWAAIDEYFEEHPDFEVMIAPKEAAQSQSPGGYDHDQSKHFRPRPSGGARHVSATCPHCETADTIPVPGFIRADRH